MMSPRSKALPTVLLVLALAGNVFAQSTNAPAGAAPTVSGPTASAGLDQERKTLLEAQDLLKNGKADAGLAKIAGVLRINPKSVDAYLLRGNYYTEQKDWAKGGADYNAALQLKPTNFAIKFNLAEIKFRQKQYDSARPDFAAIQTKDEDFNDLVAYKVYLCDLFGGHADAAAKDLAAFNQAGTNPSYYFGNAAMALYNHKTEEARDWLSSAMRIYAPKKLVLYGTSLRDTGYLPLPPPPGASAQ